MLPNGIRIASLMWDWSYSSGSRTSRSLMLFSSFSRRARASKGWTSYEARFSYSSLDVSPTCRTLERPVVPVLEISLESSVGSSTASVQAVSIESRVAKISSDVNFFILGWVRVSSFFICKLPRLGGVAWCRIGFAFLHLL